MKNDPLTSVLIGVLAISALASIGLDFFYVKYTRDYRALQAQLNGINYRRAAINLLISDTMQYSQKNPSIDPILQAAGVNVPKPAATTNKPSAK